MTFFLNSNIFLHFCMFLNIKNVSENIILTYGWKRADQKYKTAKQRDYGNLGRDFETSITVENKQLFYLAEIKNRTFTAQGSTEDIRWYSM